MFEDDTSLNASHKTTATVQNELQRSISEVSDRCDKNAMVLHPAETKKKKSTLLATRQKHQLRLLILNFSLKDNHAEQVHEHRQLGICLLYTSDAADDC